MGCFNFARGRKRLCLRLRRGIRCVGGFDGRLRFGSRNGSRNRTQMRARMRLFDGLRLKRNIKWTIKRKIMRKIIGSLAGRLRPGCRRGFGSRVGGNCDRHGCRDFGVHTRFGVRTLFAVGTILGVGIVLGVRRGRRIGQQSVQHRHERARRRIRRLARRAGGIAAGCRRRTGKMRYFRRSAGQGGLADVQKTLPITACKLRARPGTAKNCNAINHINAASGGFGLPPRVLPGKKCRPFLPGGSCLYEAQGKACPVALRGG